MSTVNDTTKSMDVFVQFSKCLGALPVDQEGFHVLQDRIMAAMDKILDDMKMPKSTAQEPVVQSQDLTTPAPFSFAGHLDPTDLASRQAAVDLLQILLDKSITPDDIAYCTRENPWTSNPKIVNVTATTTQGTTYKITTERQPAQIHVADLVVKGQARRCCGEDCPYAAAQYIHVLCFLAGQQPVETIPMDSTDSAMVCTATCLAAQDGGEAVVTKVDKPAVLIQDHMMWSRKPPAE